LTTTTPDAMQTNGGGVVNANAERDCLRVAASAHATQVENLRASLELMTNERDAAMTVRFLGFHFSRR
jgi:hypothetical protein